ncbi:basic helix-loop-helix protein [Tulasnella sp. 418]|nr:basic helix-loop-helix protein [Tulasnella sp. 418]
MEAQQQLDVAKTAASDAQPLSSETASVAQANLFQILSAINEKNFGDQHHSETSPTLPPQNGQRPASPLPPPPGAGPTPVNARDPPSLLPPDGTYAHEGAPLTLPHGLHAPPPPHSHIHSHPRSTHTLGQGQSADGGDDDEGDESGDEYIPDTQRHTPELNSLPGSQIPLSQLDSQTTLALPQSQSQTQGSPNFALGPVGGLGAGLAGNVPPSATGGKRKKGMNDEEWNRQRKDNHKEVERRRRGNINDGINQLASIVPNHTGEKAKGAILGRAVHYIRELKENEARNIEKWTLEKLLMDQAMSDLQQRLDDFRTRWEQESERRMALERELEILKAAGVQLDQGETGAKRQRVD